MKKALVINAHESYPMSEGKLNAAMADKFKTYLEKQGYEVATTSMNEHHDPEKELAKHTNADLVILQTPVNWMGVPWSFKKYMDEIYSQGMGGVLSHGDGRSSEKPTENYGGGGVLNDTKYMLSVTFNAPKEAFEGGEDSSFKGKTVDDLFFPQHMTYSFFGMKALPTFAAFDVMKNPDIENDFKRLDEHMLKYIN